MYYSIILIVCHYYQPTENPKYPIVGNIQVQFSNENESLELYHFYLTYTLKALAYIYINQENKRFFQFEIIILKYLSLLFPLHLNT